MHSSRTAMDCISLAEHLEPVLAYKQRTHRRHNLLDTYSLVYDSKCRRRHSCRMCPGMGPHSDYWCKLCAGYIQYSLYTRDDNQYTDHQSSYWRTYRWRYHRQRWRHMAMDRMDCRLVVVLLVQWFRCTVWMDRPWNADGTYRLECDFECGTLSWSRTSPRMDCGIVRRYRICLMHSLSWRCIRVDSLALFRNNLVGMSMRGYRQLVGIRRTGHMVMDSMDLHVPELVRRVAALVGTVRMGHRSY